MTISKNNHNIFADKRFKKGLAFYLCSFVLILIMAACILFLFPGRIKHQDSLITSDTSSLEQKPETKIDNSALEIPVLMYHYIRTVTDPADTLGKNLSVTPNSFNTQISWLKNNLYQTISFDEAIKIFKNEDSSPKKPIIITFDDGYDNAYTEAMPTLTKNSFIGVFYIVSGFLNKPEYLTDNQVSEMYKNGMIIGDHTKSHLDMSTSTSAVATSQIQDCKSSLEQLISGTITDFAYPSGKYNTGTIEILKALGLKTAVTTKSGIWKSTDSAYEIPRIRMTESTNLSMILK